MSSDSLPDNAWVTDARAAARSAMAPFSDRLSSAAEERSPMKRRCSWAMLLPDAPVKAGSRGKAAACTGWVARAGHREP